METQNQQTTALLVIDFINEIVDVKGKLAGKGYANYVAAHNTFSKLNLMIEKAREKGMPVLFVRLGFSPGYTDWPSNSPLFGSAKKFGALQLGTWATDIHEAIVVKSTDQIITKNRVSAFYNTILDELLRKQQIHTLLIAGVATDLAVQSTARDAHDRDYKVVVLEDVCAAASDEDHIAAISLIAKIATIVDSSSVLELQ